MALKNLNHPFVVWSSCILWVISIFCIVWSLLLFFCISDILFLTGTDLINAVVLLSGIMMLPTNLYIVYSIASGQRVEYTAKVFCCRLWMSIVWTIIINLVGVILCLQRIYLCEAITMNYLITSMKQYRTMPKHKHFIDNLQWSLGCCGVNSYTDWFTRNWHDKIRDFDWSPTSNKFSIAIRDTENTDSVPLSCCKSGSCVASYLKELGSYSINTIGCGQVMYHIIMISMNAHLVMFVVVIVLEAFLLKCIIINKKGKVPFVSKVGRKLKLNQIMSVNDNFEISSASYQINEDDSEDDLEASRHYRDMNGN